MCKNESDAIEAAAKTLQAECFATSNTNYWSELDEDEQENRLDEARAIVAAYDAARSGERWRAIDGTPVERVAAALWTKATEQEIERTGTDFNVAHIRYEDAEEWRKVWVRGQAQAVLAALGVGA
jgi:uncharacterized metal-binding protein